MERFPRRGITAVMATFLKIAARISAIGTLAVAALIFGWQAGSWILTDEWRSFPISRALALAGLERESIYVTASASEPSYSSGFQRVLDWFLDLPATGFLGRRIGAFGFLGLRHISRETIRDNRKIARCP